MWVYFVELELLICRRAMTKIRPTKMAIMMTKEAIATVPITGSKKSFMKPLVTIGSSGTGLSEDG